MDDDISNECKKILKNLPDLYKLRDYEAESLTDLHTLYCLKMFIQKDVDQNGTITQEEMHDILLTLGFKTSKQEIEYIVKAEFFFTSDYPIERSRKEKITSKMFIIVVDLLKREKLVLVEIAYYLNYIIFGLFLLLIGVYIKYFHIYK